MGLSEDTITRPDIHADTTRPSGLCVAGSIPANSNLAVSSFFYHHHPRLFRRHFEEARKVGSGEVGRPCGGLAPPPPEHNNNIRVPKKCVPHSFWPFTNCLST